MYYLKGKVITHGEILPDRFIEVENNEIQYVGHTKRMGDYPTVEVTDGFICPGLVDIHIHAISGADFMDGEGAFSEITERLVQYGVTSMLATSRTGSLQDIQALLSSADQLIHQGKPGTQIMGVHLEGPWISPQYRGAQPQDYIRKLTWKDIEKVIDPYQKIISMITLAPEEIADPVIIDYLRSQHINISAGHTAATIDDIDWAIERGLNFTTHTFNAMSPVHHRNPGTAAAAMLYEELTCEVITDGIHVHPKIIELLYQTKGKEGLVFISDCTGYDHLEDGHYHVRGKDISKQGQQVTLSDGTIAGSTLTLDQGIKFAVEKCNIPLEDAVFMATQSPLDALGLEHCKRGKIAAGYQADFAIFDSELNISKTMINGEIVYEAAKLS